MSLGPRTDHSRESLAFTTNCKHVVIDIAKRSIIMFVNGIQMIHISLEIITEDSLKTYVCPPISHQNLTYLKH